MKTMKNILPHKSISRMIKKMKLGKPPPKKDLFTNFTKIYMVNKSIFKNLNIFNPLKIRFVQIKKKPIDYHCILFFNIIAKEK